MIKIVAGFRQRTICSIEVSGHSGYDRSGRDIVCAAVSSAVQMAANGITEILGISAEVSAHEDTVSILLPENCERAGTSFLEALLLHLKILTEEYGDHIHIIEMEVHNYD